MKEVEQFWNNRLKEIDEKISIGKEGMKEYDTTEKQKIRQQEKEMKEEMDKDWVKSCRKDYVENKIKYLEDYLTFLLDWYIEFFNKDYPYFLKERPMNDALRVIGTINKLKWELRWIENPELSKGTITPEMVKRAKDYSIKDLLNTKSDFVKCPFHNEKAASFYLKGNFGYCFSCHESVDSIELVRKLENLDFIGAVRRLQ